MRTKNIVSTMFSLYILIHALLILSIYQAINENETNDDITSFRKRATDALKYSLDIPVAIVSILYHISRKPE